MKYARFIFGDVKRKLQKIQNIRLLVYIFILHSSIFSITSSTYFFPLVVRTHGWLDLLDMLNLVTRRCELMTEICESCGSFSGREMQLMILRNQLY